MADTKLPTSTSECPTTRSTPSTVITAYTGTSTSPRWDLAANAWAQAPQAAKQTNSIPVIQENSSPKAKNLKRKLVITEDEPAEVLQPKKNKTDEKIEKIVEDPKVNNNTEENPHIKPYTPEAVNDPSTSIKSEDSKKASSNTESKRLHVSNIPFRFREPDLREMFEKFGKVTEVEIIFNDRGSKGFGFVSYADKDDADRAKREINHTKIDGRMIEVNDATARNKSKRGPASTQQVMMGLPGALPGAFMNPMIRPQCLIRPGLVVPHEGNPFMRHIIQSNPMFSNPHGGALGMSPMMLIDQNRLLAQQQLQQQLQQQQMMQQQQIQLAALNNQVMMGNPLIAQQGLNPSLPPTGYPAHLFQGPNPLHSMNPPAQYKK